MFGLPLIGGLWLPSKYHDREWKHTTVTKEEIGVLQTTQNQLMRVLTGLKDWDTPTSELLQESGLLSVYQLAFYAIATQGHKTLLTGKPSWLDRQLHLTPATRTSEAGLRPVKSRTNLREECLAAKTVNA